MIDHLTWKLFSNVDLSALTSPIGLFQLLLNVGHGLPSATYAGAAMDQGGWSCTSRSCPC